MTETTAPARVGSRVDGPSLFTMLTASGDRTAPALVLADATTTIRYADLPSLTDDWCRALAADRKALVLCLAGRNIATTACYLAVLRLGHAVAMLDAAASETARERFLAAYQPDFVASCADPADHRETTPRPMPPGYHHHAEPTGAPVWARRHGGRESDAEIHPDLALLLSTSGSTGNPKAVRLSYGNVASNSASVAESIGVTDADRAATALPLHFGYGLSVLCSHLISGATVALRSERPASLGFWRHFAAAGCTNFPGVAPTYELMWRMVSDLDRVPTLRTMTCSGSRLRHDLVLRYAEFMSRRGGRLFMMYGQTESTSRISCLDPAYLPGRLGSVGRAIPRGRLSIHSDGSTQTDTADRRSGEIVYTGPNVMLGYAESRMDLSTGDSNNGVLHTGDLGYLDDGFLYLTGRSKRIAKVVGLRLSLDDVERMFDDAGTVVAVDAGERGIVLFTEGAHGPLEAARHRVASDLGIPASLLTIRPVARLPRTATGKIEYRKLTGCPDPDP